MRDVRVGGVVSVSARVIPIICDECMTFSRMASFTVNMIVVSPRDKTYGDGRCSRSFLGRVFFAVKPRKVDTFVLL